MIFGRVDQKPKDRATIMILPGINDDVIMEMGRGGMLRGRALAMYRKLEKLEG
jgi:hypothetical protein